MKKHETRLRTVAIEKYELWKNYAFESIVCWNTRCCYLCKYRRRYDQFSNVLFIKLNLPMKKNLRAQQQTAQPAACRMSCTSSCVWWNCLVNFHRLGMINPDAPLTCNAPAAALLQTKKTIVAKSYITKHEIIALGSRFFETKNIIDVLPCPNLFLKRVSAALIKDTPEMK